MGDVTVSTNDTFIYYPSNWLIEGGPPFESMSCPKAEPGYDDLAIPLELIYNSRTEYFGISMLDFILIESTNAKDIAKYVQDYVQGFQDWLAKNKEANNDAAVDN